MRRDRDIHIGLTGGFGSGKSTVLGYFKEFGAEIFLCDEVVHKLLKEDRYLIKKIASAFGSFILRKDGKINKRRLAKEVFSDERKVKILNEIVHPRVKEQVRKFLREKRRCLCVVEVPLLFEAGMKDWFDIVVLVYAPPEICKKRLLKIGKYCIEDIEYRMFHQMDIDVKKAKADVVIDNTGPRRSTKKQVKELLKQLGYNFKQGGGR